MKFTFRRALAVALFLFVRVPSLVHAYGPTGHEIVGGIADERLAKTETGKKVSALLGGISLQKAANMADVIKSWDKKGPDDPKSFHYSAWPEIDKQLVEFWKANQPTHDLKGAMPSHHWFHYTDVPVVPPQKYSAGKAGRSKWDVVHMIPYCVDVLRGRVQEENDRKITKPVAIVLLAHYVGDIHQPLHVGALFFDSEGKIVDPDKEPSALGDEGGNTFYLELSDQPPRTPGQHKKKFHGFWDEDAVNALFPDVPAGLPKKERQDQIEPGKKKLIHELAMQEPKNWRLPAKTDLSNYAEAWADEILPIAREAHERIEFRNVKPLQQEDRVVATGDAFEKPAYDKTKDAEAKINNAKNQAKKEYDNRADAYKQALDEINNMNKQLESPTTSADAKTKLAKERDDKITSIKNMEREINEFRQTRERQLPDSGAYRAWVTRTVREELHKAGWRLADLLEKALSH